MAIQQQSIVDRSYKLLVLPGDGIGAEIMPHAIRVMNSAVGDSIGLNLEYADFGGCSIDNHGVPMTDETLALAQDSDAVLLGAVGGPKWDDLPVNRKPEKGLLGLRAGLDCFANLRPALTFGPLSQASTLKSELVSDLDILIVRELTGGVYFGEPRGIELRNNLRTGYNTFLYDESEIQRVSRVAFELARKRSCRLCSVDKANVLEVTQLWRDVICEVHADYKDVELNHLYVDNAAMQLVRQPKQFDVIVTGNMFGDILSDVAAMLTGSLGMLPSASLNASNRGLYEPVHGTAPDIAGQNVANPLAMILSIAMMFRYSLDAPQIADSIEKAVQSVLEQGFRTRDIMPIDSTDECELVGTDRMADEVVSQLKD
ncbi:MAG: 3-isopropylmalate dehydrogenase [Gammaproteobacteria bacterium]|nr:3-isopropylmalate dehydrogenase [Gammaproteobacteria bacterium]